MCSMDEQRISEKEKEILAVKTISLKNFFLNWFLKIFNTKRRKGWAVRLMILNKKETSLFSYTGCGRNTSNILNSLLGSASELRQVLIVPSSS